VNQSRVSIRCLQILCSGHWRGDEGRAESDGRCARALDDYPIMHACAVSFRSGGKMHPPPLQGRAVTLGSVIWPFRGCPIP